MNEIKDICYKRAHEIYGEKLPKEVEERLELELNTIIKNKFETKYLIAKDIVDKLKEWNYTIRRKNNTEPLL